jgi:hypothetical protein
VFPNSVAAIEQVPLQNCSLKCRRLKTSAEKYGCCDRKHGDLQRGTSNACYKSIRRDNGSPVGTSPFRPEAHQRMSALVSEPVAFFDRALGTRCSWHRLCTRHAVAATVHPTHTDSVYEWRPKQLLPVM